MFPHAFFPSLIFPGHTIAVSPNVYVTHCMPTHSIRSHATYTHQVILLPRNLLLSKHSHPSLVRLSRVSRSIAISTGDEGLWTEVLQHQFDVYGHEGGQKALGTNDSTYLQTSLSLFLNSCAYTHTRHDRKSDHRPQNSLLLTNIQCKNCMWAYRKGGRVSVLIGIRRTGRPTH